MVGDDVLVLRMVWHPAHFDNDKLNGAAFDSADLRPDLDANGHPRFLSVDQGDLICKHSVDYRIDDQQKDGKSESCKRLEARFVEFSCADLRRHRLDGDSETVIFNVTSEPVTAGLDGSPANPAHCGIRHVSGKTGGKGEMRRHVQQLRTSLLKLKKNIFTYDGIFNASP